MQNILQAFYRAVSTADKGSLQETVARYLCSDATVGVAHPINDLQGVAAVTEQLVQPLLKAFPDLERKEFVSVSAKYEGAQWINGTGYLLGTFKNALFGIPATDQIAYLRYTEMVRLEQGKIAEYYLILDFIDLMNQAGVNPLRSSLGHSGLIMPPSDRLLGLVGGDAEAGEVSQQLVLDMLDCLGRYDGQSLTSMALEQYWAPDFIWYGPAGIGTTRGIEGFRQQHQGPFLEAFPNRVVDRKVNILGCGDYASTGGWPHMTATHSGGGWLGLGPTGLTVTMRVMDIWRRQGHQLHENWVGIDIIHILAQLGLDVFDQMRQLIQRGRRYA